MAKETIDATRVADIANELVQAGRADPEFANGVAAAAAALLAETATAYPDPPESLNRMLGRHRALARNLMRCTLAAAAGRGVA